MTTDQAQPVPSGGVSSGGVLRVSARSKPAAVAGAIAGVVRARRRAEVQAIGAAAVNQAVKAVAIARGFLVPAGLDLVCRPAFTEVPTADGERTVICLILEVH